MNKSTENQASVIYLLLDCLLSFAHFENISLTDGVIGLQKVRLKSISLINSLGTHSSKLWNYPKQKVLGFFFNCFQKAWLSLFALFPAIIVNFRKFPSLRKPRSNGFPYMVTSYMHNKEYNVYVTCKTDSTWIYCIDIICTFIHSIC